MTVWYEWCLYEDLDNDGQISVVFANAGELGDRFLPSEVNEHGRMPQLSLIRHWGVDGDREDAWVRENGELDIAFVLGNKVPKKFMAEFKKNKALASQCIDGNGYPTKTNEQIDAENGIVRPRDKWEYL